MVTWTPMAGLRLRSLLWILNITILLWKKQAAKMPPKGKKGKKGKKKGKDTPAPEEKPKTPEPTEKEILLQEEYV